MSTSTPTIGVKIDPLMKQRLQQLAKARHRTPHWVMREAIEQYGVPRRNRRKFRHPISSPAKSVSRSINLPPLWNV